MLEREMAAVSVHGCQGTAVWVWPLGSVATPFAHRLVQGHTLDAVMAAVDRHAKKHRRNPARLLLLRKWLWSYTRHVAYALAKVGSGSCSLGLGFRLHVRMSYLSYESSSEYEVVDIVCMTKSCTLFRMALAMHGTAVGLGNSKCIQGVQHQVMAALQ